MQLKENIREEIKDLLQNHLPQSWNMPWKKPAFVRLQKEDICILLNQNKF